MTPVDAVADGHVRYRDWRITVACHRSDIGGLKLWLEAARIGPDGMALSAPAAFGLVRIDQVHPLQILLAPIVSGLAVVPRSILADGIVCRALQIHLAAESRGYNIALVSETWLDGTDVSAELQRLAAAARTGVCA